MPAPLAVLALLAQLAFALLPGHGLVLCLGGHDGHGAGAHAEHAGGGPNCEDRDSEGRSTPTPSPVHHESDDCDGVHLERGEGDPLRPSSAPRIAPPALVLVPEPRGPSSARGSALERDADISVSRFRGGESHARDGSSARARSIAGPRGLATVRIQR